MSNEAQNFQDTLEKLLESNKDSLTEEEKTIVREMIFYWSSMKTVGRFTSFFVKSLIWIAITIGTLTGIYYQLKGYWK